jgi:hypothetical protein
MTENSNERQDPATPYRTDKAQETAPQPSPVPVTAEGSEGRDSEAEADAYKGYSVVAGREVQNRGENNEDLSES